MMRWCNWSSTTTNATFLFLDIYMEKTSGNKRILMIIWLENKKIDLIFYHHKKKKKKKGLVKVVTWVETCVRSIDCRRANHEIKLVLSMFYFLESFWNPRLIPRTTQEEKSSWNLNTWFKKKEVF